MITLIALLSLASSATLVLVGSATPVHADPPYSIIDIGSLDGPTGVSQGEAISSTGVVVGQAYVSSSQPGDAVSFSDGTLTDLGVFGSGDTSLATSVNASGVVAGEDTNFSNQPPTRAVEFSGGTLIDLTPPTAFIAEPTSINDSATIVGFTDIFVPGGTDEVAVRFDGGGSVTNLGILPGGQSEAVADAISDTGTVVGWADDASGTPQAVTFDGGAASELPNLPSATDSIATAISSDGDFIVGYRVLPSSPYQQAVQYAPGASATALGQLPGDESSEAYGVNSSGTAVGVSISASLGQRAVMFTGGSVVDLNTVLPPNSGWTLQQAKAINDAGQITGVGMHNGIQRGLLLTPAPPPALPQGRPFLLLAGALGVIGGSMFIYRRRRPQGSPDPESQVTG